MANGTIGFIGLGNMGAPIAERIAGGGFDLKVFDVADAQARAPFAKEYASSAAGAGEGVDVVFLCLPAARISTAVAQEIAALGSNRPKVVVETSTIGPSAAREAAATLQAAGIGYVDAPVSGGVARARTGELSSMAAGSEDDIATASPAMATYAAHIRHVGPNPGQGQAMKLANNYASIATMLATSEAISYGLRQGLTMEGMLAVMNAAAGESFATKVHFPKHIVNGAYDSAAAASIVWKDLSLFVQEARGASSAVPVATAVRETFGRFMEDADPAADWLRVYEFIRDREERG
jgi:3-hydroxyisobutyrate dehydrogenase-like beta-hydroxyacid dehydrogenase